MGNRFASNKNKLKADGMTEESQEKVLLRRLTDDLHAISLIARKVKHLFAKEAFGCDNVMSRLELSFLRADLDEYRNEKCIDKEILMPLCKNFLLLGEIAKLVKKDVKRMGLSSKLADKATVLDQMIHNTLPELFLLVTVMGMKIPRQRRILGETCVDELAMKSVPHEHATIDCKLDIIDCHRDFALLDELSFELDLFRIGTDYLLQTL